MLSMAFGLLAGSDSKRQTWLGGGGFVGRVWGAKRSHFESGPGREAEYQQNQMRKRGSVKLNFRVADCQTGPRTGLLALVPVDPHTVPSVICFCT